MVGPGPIGRGHGPDAADGLPVGQHCFRVTDEVYQATGVL